MSIAATLLGCAASGQGDGPARIGNDDVSVDDAGLLLPYLADSATGTDAPSETAEASTDPSSTKGGADAATTKAPPYVIFLDYAPSYAFCKAGSGDGPSCRKAIAGYLDQIYADFNVVFTETMPSGPHFEVHVTSGSDTGIAKNTCDMTFPSDGASVGCAVGGDPHTCAVLIAQEHGHLVGLKHTTTREDVMCNPVGRWTVGFAHTASTVSDQACRATQDSYALMKERLGAWPGGAKPGATL
jgi:hypothetical protein